MSDLDRLIVEALYVSWEAGELEAMVRNVADDIQFAVYRPVHARFWAAGAAKRCSMHVCGRSSMNTLSSTTARHRSRCAMASSTAASPITIATRRPA